MRIGFIGLGDQGGPMTEMMLAAGLDLSIWARREEVRQAFAARGARLADSPAALAATSDLLGLCVTGDADIRQLVFDQGVLVAMAPGAILAIHSTVRPQLCEEVAAAAAERGVEVLDAPVSGSGHAARARNLLVMVGGGGEALDRARPAFQPYADPIIHVGAVGAAMRVKLLNNLTAAAQHGVAARALRGAEVNGLDPETARRVMLAGTARSFSMDALARLQDPERARHIRSIVTKDLALARDALDGEALAPLFELADEAMDWMQRWSEGRDRVLPQA